MPTTHRAPLIVATDASVGHFQGPPLAGIAWIASTGAYAMDVRTSRAPMVGELAAIHLAVTDPRLTGPLTILCDCRRVVNALERVRATGVIRTERSVPEHWQVARLLRLVVIELRRRPIELRYVKGHTGHPLNEAADRLAVQARRCTQNGGRLGAISALTDRIAADAHAPRQLVS